MAARLVIGNKNYSSWSLRAWLLLREAGIEFQETRIALDTSTWAEEIAHFSAADKVPILILDGTMIWDSMAIAETVAERWPEKRLWPAEAGQRAHARSISNEMHSGFSVLRERLPMNCRAMGRQVKMSDALYDDIARIVQIWSECQQRYGDNGPWLFGEFGIADAMFAPVVLRFRTYGIEIPAAAGAYPQRLLESAAMQEWLAAAESETEVIEAEEKGQR